MVLPYRVTTVATAFNTFVGNKKDLPGRTPFLISSDVPGKPRPSKDEAPGKEPAPEEEVRASKEFAELETYENFIATVTDQENRYCNLYEIVDRMDAPVMAMFDIDKKSGVTHTPLEVFTALADVVSRVMKEQLGRDFTPVPGETCQVSDSSTDCKLSLHVKLDVGMRSVHDNKRLALWMIDEVLRSDAYPELIDANSKTGTVIDLDIYTNWRQFRMLYQAKLYTNRFKLPAFGSSRDVKEHLWRFHPGHTREPLWWADLPAETTKKATLSIARAAAAHKKTPGHEVKNRMDSLVEKTRYFNGIEALKKVMSGPVDVMAIKRLTDGRDATVHTLRDAVCPYKGSKHSNNHVYLLTHAGSSDIHVRCHNEKCKECPQWNIHDYSAVDTPWYDEVCLDGMHQQAANIEWAEDYDEPEMRDLPVERIVMVRAGMGTGKTKALLRLAERELVADASKKALIVTFSRTLAAKLHADFAHLGFVDYMSVKGGAPLAGPRIVVCLDSLWRVNTRNFDYVFIDEAVSVFLHFNSTKMERAHVNSGILELLLLQCERMYFVDACVDTTMMKQISDYFAVHRGCGTHWVRNRHVRPSNRKATIETCMAHGSSIADNIIAMNAMGRVVSLLEAGKNVVVCTSTKHFATTLEEYVRQKRGSTSVLSYYSGKSESLKNVESLWTSCQLLIYSPSVSAGVSFEGTHFDALVGFLVNSPATPSIDLSLQQLFRVRNLSDGDMHLYVQDFNADEDMPCTDEKVHAMLSSDASIPNKYYLEPHLQAMSSTTIQDGRLMYDSTRMSYLIVKGIVTMRNKSMTNYRAILSKTLREDYGIPCAESYTDVAAHDLDIDVAREASKVTNDVKFEDIPIFALMEHGDARYRAVADNMERASDADKAGKVLHDYAIRMWGVPPEKIDESFYSDHVKPADASVAFFKAKRLMTMQTQSATEISHAMSRAMDAVMATSDANIKVYRTKLKTHYTLLLKGQELVQGCLTESEAARFRAFEDVTITDATMCERLAALKASMDAADLKQFFKILDLKSTATPFVQFRKILVCAFGVAVERQNDDKRLKAWHSIDIKLDRYRDMKQAYSPSCLEVDQPDDTVVFSGPRFRHV
jgi:Origin of replication binding protein